MGCNMKKFYALFIIFILAISPCASATRDVTFPINTHEISNSLDNSTTPVLELYSNSDETLNYTTFLDYILHTKDSDQSKWILLNGDGSDLSQYNYTICNNYTQPNGYHKLSDNYKDAPLDSDYWSGTLYYTENNYILKSQILINNSVNIDAFNYACFIQDIKDNLYWKNVPVRQDFPDFPYDNETLKEMFSWYSQVDTPKIFNNMVKVHNWVDYAINSRNKKLQDSMVTAELIDLQNTKVSKARGEKGGHYWSPDIMAGYFENVDDGGLEIINMYDQQMKIPLDKVRFAISTVCLELESAKLIVDWAAAAIPSDYGMDKPLKFLSLTIASLKLALQWTSNAIIESPYHELDQATMAVSAEKSYRKLVSDGRMTPADPTQSDIENQNKYIDERISELNKELNFEKERIYNTDESEIKQNLTDFKKLMEDTLWMLNKYNGLPEHKKYCEDMIKLCDDRLTNIDEYVKQLKHEKELYPKFEKRINDQIDLLNNSRWKK